MSDPVSYDYLALRSAVCADPKDDHPRYVMADWLMESGMQEWSDFILWQLRNPSLAGYLDCNGAHVGEEQDRIIGPSVVLGGLLGWFQDHARSINRSRTVNHAVNPWKWWWRRGFVDQVDMPGDAVIDLGDLRRVHPITRVVLTSEPSGEVQGWLTKRRSGWDRQWQACLIAKHPGVEFSWPTQTTTMRDARWFRPWGRPMEWDAERISEAARRMAEEIERQSIDGFYREPPVRFDPNGFRLPRDTGLLRPSIPPLTVRDTV